MQADQDILFDQSYGSLTAIHNTYEDIGGRNSTDFLSQSLPMIIQRKDAIVKALAQKDTEDACQCANRTLSSIRLYGSDKLEMLLRQVHETSDVDTDFPKLSSSINQEFDSVIQTLKEWLSSPPR